jgi:hypothetical protein
MADVFISYARSDNLIANILKDKLLKMGVSTFIDFNYLTQGDDFGKIIKKIEYAGINIIIWSMKAADSTWIKRELHLALKAWENDRLILFQMDNAELPFGLRDLPTIIIPPESRPEEAATAIADEVRRRLGGTLRLQPSNRAPPADPTLLPAPIGLPSARSAASKISLATLLAFFLLMGGLGLWWLVGWPTPMPLPPPGPLPWPPLEQARPEASIPAIATGEMIAGLVVIIIVVVLIFVSVFFLFWGRHSIPRRAATPAQMQNKEQYGDPRPPPQSAIFVSYSRDDGPKVTIIVDELERSGLRTWIDTRRESDAQRFARPIVQAIRTSKACAFMCSPTAYRSDHVVRELYLADKYGKTMIPVEIEPDALPEDFEYFFSGLDVVPAKPVDRCVQAIMRRLQSIG